MTVIYEYNKLNLRPKSYHKDYSSGTFHDILEYALAMTLKIPFYQHVNHFGLPVSQLKLKRKLQCHFYELSLTTLV